MSMPLIPDQYQETASKNHFPILLQLGILLIILTGLFGSLWLTGSNTADQTTQEQYQTVPLHAAAAATVLHDMENISLRAEAAYVWDVRGERALYKKNESLVLPLASITKLMTGLLVYELYAEDETVTVPLAAIRQEGSSGLTAGEVLTTEELTTFALMSSSNDAAYALAATVGSALGDRDPVAQFVASMNIRADELGLDSLEFKNMTGLDVSASEPGAIGTARDASFLMEYILERYPELLNSTTFEGTRIFNEAGLFHEISNTNPVTSQIPNLIASKTGYTDLAGGNLTVAFDLGNNRPIIITVLGSTRDERFSDVLTLVEAIQSSVNTQFYE